MSTAGPDPRAASALLGLGSNLGDRRGNIERALRLLEASGACRIVAVSRLIETQPAGGPPQGLYLNGAAEVTTELDAPGLLRLLHDVEANLGRVRGVRNAPREIDLDLLLYDDLVIAAPGIEVPHPRMLERLFVLEPAAEIAPGRIHPVTGRSLRYHLQDLEAASRAGGPR